MGTADDLAGDVTGEGILPDVLVVCSIWLAMEDDRLGTMCTMAVGDDDVRLGISGGEVEGDLLVLLRMDGLGVEGLELPDAADSVAGC